MTIRLSLTVTARLSLTAALLCVVPTLTSRAATPPPASPPVQQSPLAQLPNGRLAGHNDQLQATGIRAPAPASNYALVVTVSEYPRSPLPGVLKDRGLIMGLTQRFGIPAENVMQLSEANVTREGLRQAFASLNRKILPGDRLLVYFSGHGARFLNPAAGQCMESIVMQDLHVLTNSEFADLIKPLSRKTDKTIVMLDSCHSGGVAQASARDIGSRGAPKARPKFSPEASSAECSRVANLRSFARQRGSDFGTTDNNLVILAAARDDEVAWDTEEGGAMTYNISQCVNGSAADTDNSGAISMQELAACVQSRLDKMQSEAVRQHATLAGNGGLVPAFTEPEASSSPGGGTVDTLATLNDVYSQRDDRWEVTASLDKPSLKIGEALGFSVRSQRDGYLYVFYRGTQPDSFYLLFPNQLDQDNGIKADQELRLPRDTWAVTALGPSGVDHLLVMVTQTPRDFSSLALPAEYVSPEGPFGKIHPTPQAAARIGQLATLSASVAQPQCQGAGDKRDLGIARRCSNAFGASLVSVEETP